MNWKPQFPPILPVVAAALMVLAIQPRILAAEPVEPGIISFLGDGRITALTVAGQDVAAEDADRNGLAVLWFDGMVVKTTPLTRVTASAEGWVARGERELPRCTLEVQPDGARTLLRLVRVEGFPLGRDTSLALHLGTASPVRVTCPGAGVAVRAGARGVDVTWKYPGQPGALATYDAVALEVGP